MISFGPLTSLRHHAKNSKLGAKIEAIHGINLQYGMWQPSQKQASWHAVQAARFSAPVATG